MSDQENAATDSELDPNLLVFTGPEDRAEDSKPPLAAALSEDEFLAFMAGAMELKERFGDGRYVEFEGKNYHAFFSPTGAQDPAQQRRVSFSQGDNRIHASAGLGMKEAAYIVALGQKQWNGLKLLSGASADDKLKLYMAAQTHHLRVLVTQLQHGSITTEGKQKLADYIADPSSVPAVMFQDSAALDGATYKPPAQITRLIGENKVQVDTANEIAAMKQELVERALAHDPSLRPAAGAIAPHVSSAFPAGRQCFAPWRLTGVKRKQRRAFIRRVLGRGSHDNRRIRIPSPGP